MTTMKETGKFSRWKETHLGLLQGMLISPRSFIVQIIDAAVKLQEMYKIGMAFVVY